MTHAPLDPTRCPDCGGQLDGTPHCPACGLLVQGPDAARLWQVATEIARLQYVRAMLLDSLRGRPAGPPPPAAYAPWPQAPRPTALRPPPVPRREWTPRRVQNLLLTVGALLLVTAAIAFTALSWGRLPIAARGGVMLGVTAIAGWTAHWLLRRGLTSSAEAIGLLAVLFGVVDAYAARRANLGGLRGTDEATYWSVASGVVAALAVLYGQVVRVRSVRYAALVAAQLPLVLTAARIHGLTAADRGAFLVAQAALLLLLAPRLRDVTLPAHVSGIVNWSFAGLLALTTAYDSEVTADVRRASVVLVLLGATALLWPGDRAVPAGALTLAAVLAAVAPSRLTLTDVQRPALVAACGLLAVVAVATLPPRWRLGPVVVGAGTVGYALATVSGHAGEAVLLPFSWLGSAWDLHGDVASRVALDADGLPWHGSVVSLAVVAVAAVTVVIGAEALGRRTWAWWAMAFAALAVVMTPVGFAWSYRVALAWDVGVGVAVLALAAALRRVEIAAPATAILLVATGWAVAEQEATLAVLLVVTLAYAGYAVADGTTREYAAGLAAAGAAAYAVAIAAARGAPADRSGFVLATAGFSLAGAATLLRLRSVEGVAAAAYVVGLALAAPDPGWLAWSLGGGAVVAGALALRADRRLLAGLSAALGVACAGTAAIAYDAPLDRTGFVVAVAAACAVGAGTVLRGRTGDLVEAVGGAGYVVALALSLPDNGWLSWTLALGGVVALAEALRPERRALGWVATGLLTAWSWDRLWIEDVRVPEAYAAPVVVLTLALGHLRRRRYPETGSWEAYGWGLVAGFAPTAFVLVDDSGVTRPVVMGVAGVVVLLAGVRERLQAPLTVGALALGVDAVVQLAPAVAALPKWATIGAAGLVVIAVGVTYEDRRRDVTRLRETFDRLV